MSTREFATIPQVPCMPIDYRITSMELFSGTPLYWLERTTDGGQRWERVAGSFDLVRLAEYRDAVQRDPDAELCEAVFRADQRTLEQIVRSVGSVNVGPKPSHA
ncbi:MAG TPA: hypothetical protein VEI97_20690 [bacterium]|nr:hypothetical protein [bacterium]